MCFAVFGHLIFLNDSTAMAVFSGSPLFIIPVKSGLLKGGCLFCPEEEARQAEEGQREGKGQEEEEKEAEEGE
jgi:hypothetical protein